MFDASTLVPDRLGEGLRLAWGARLLDDAATFVDDADVRLVERHIETYEEFHGLNSLIGCDAGEDPDVYDWRKARSAHLYRQAGIYKRQGIALDRATLATGSAAPASTSGRSWSTCASA
jgi:hypothetical protein